RRDLLVIGWERRYGAFQIANRREMFVQTKLVFLRQSLSQQRRILTDRVEDAAFAIDPALVSRAEEAIEQPVRDLLGRQRPVRTPPAKLPLDGPAERFLRHADLQRAEPGVVTQSRGEKLIEGRPARAPACVAGTSHQRAHG